MNLTKESLYFDKDLVINTRVDTLEKIVTPQELLEKFTLESENKKKISRYRNEISNILKGVDDRLIVVVGPCSIHDVIAATEYANFLSTMISKHRDTLRIVMRVYFEKPRTTIGWKGLIYDPDLDGSSNINKGLNLAREFLLKLNIMDVPAGCEFLDTITPQYISDLVSWAAIGARTTESQIHRQLASGSSMPIGFKNGTGGSMKLAAEAIVCAKNPHCFLGTTKEGEVAIVRTHGNSDCHIILRGGSDGPNYDKEHILQCEELLHQSKIPVKIMVDCSHGNSRKIHTNQPLVVDDIVSQIQEGNKSIVGVMIESNLQEGKQSMTATKNLEYGKSITDACINWETTSEVLQKLSDVILERREKESGIYD